MAPIANIHTIITDAGTSQDFIAAAQDKGIRVIVA
jgi:DeoR/GlpR family transcriptional regulator of sugar metabolism